jgi:hypothetical protein
MAVILHGSDRRNHIFVRAASAAALAACGLDELTPPLNATERAQLRQQALAWLCADVAGLRDWLESAPNKAWNDVRDITQYRLQDADYAGVREAEALAKLPEGERQEWQRLWDEFDKLRRYAAAMDTPESQPIDQ